MRLRVRAPDLGSLLAEAGRALAALELRGRTDGPPGDWLEIAVEAADPGALLVDWLNELIYRAESGRVVPTDFEILESGPERVRARVRGPAVAEAPSLVKAATLHRVRVAETEEGVEADVVLDV